MPIIIVSAIGLIGLIAVSLFTAIALRRVVPTNMVHIVQAGRKTTSYGKDSAAGNVYYEVPFFVPVFGVSVIKLPVNNFDVPLDNYPAYDANRVPFQVDVRGFFRIKDPNMAANRVATFDDLRRQLTEILRGSVRSVLASHRLEEILGIRTELGVTFTQQVDAQLAEYGVETIKTIEFMDMRDVSDSTVIHDIMAKDKARISMESRVAIAKNSQAAELAEVDAKQQVDLRKQEAAQTVGQRTAEQEREVGIARQQASQAQLEESKKTAAKEMEVQQVRKVQEANIAKEVAQVAAEQKRSVTIIEAEAAKEQQRITAEGERLKTETVSVGALAAAKNEAEGIRARGEAEGRAKEAINLADVAPQITLAKEIGENKPYQEYLVQIEQIKITGSVGVAQAEALAKADIKVIANGGDIQTGFSSIGDVLSTRGGTNLAGWLASLAQTDEGAALLKRFGVNAPETDSRPGPMTNGRA